MSGKADLKRKASVASELPNKMTTANKLGRPRNVGDEQYDHIMSGYPDYAAEKLKKTNKEPHNIGKVFDAKTVDFIAKYGWINPFRTLTQDVSNATAEARAAAEAAVNQAAAAVAKGPGAMDAEKFAQQKAKDQLVKLVRGEITKLYYRHRAAGEGQSEPARPAVDIPKLIKAIMSKPTQRQLYLVWAKLRERPELEVEVSKRHAAAIAEKGDSSRGAVWNTVASEWFNACSEDEKVITRREALKILDIEMKNWEDQAASEPSSPEEARDTYSFMEGSEEFLRAMMQFFANRVSGIAVMFLAGPQEVSLSEAVCEIPGKPKVLYSQISNEETTLRLMGGRILTQSQLLNESKWGALLVNEDDSTVQNIEAQPMDVDDLTDQNNIRAEPMDVDSSIDPALRPPQKEAPSTDTSAATLCPVPAETNEGAYAADAAEVTSGRAGRQPSTSAERTSDFASEGSEQATAQTTVDTPPRAAAEAKAKAARARLDLAKLEAEVAEAEAAELAAVAARATAETVQDANVESTPELQQPTQPVTPNPAVTPHTTPTPTSTGAPTDNASVIAFDPFQALADQTQSKFQATFEQASLAIQSRKKWWEQTSNPAFFRSVLSKLKHGGADVAVGCRGANQTYSQGRVAFPALASMAWPSGLSPGREGVRTLVVTVLNWGSHMQNKSVEQAEWRSVTADMAHVLRILAEKGGQDQSHAPEGRKRSGLLSLPAGLDISIVGGAEDKSPESILLQCRSLTARSFIRSQTFNSSVQTLATRGFNQLVSGLIVPLTYCTHCHTIFGVAPIVEDWDMPGKPICTQYTAINVFLDKRGVMLLAENERAKGQSSVNKRQCAWQDPPETLRLYTISTSFVSRFWSDGWNDDGRWVGWGEGDDGYMWWITGPTEQGGWGDLNETTGWGGTAGWAGQDLNQGWAGSNLNAEWGVGAAGPLPEAADIPFEPPSTSTVIRFVQSLGTLRLDVIVYILLLFLPPLDVIPLDRWGSPLASECFATITTAMRASRVWYATALATCALWGGLLALARTRRQWLALNALAGDAPRRLMYRDGLPNEMLDAVLHKASAVYVPASSSWRHWGVILEGREMPHVEVILLLPSERLKPPGRLDTPSRPLFAPSLRIFHASSPCLVRANALHTLVVANCAPDQLAGMIKELRSLHRLEIRQTHSDEPVDWTALLAEGSWLLLEELRIVCRDFQGYALACRTIPVSTPSLREMYATAAVLVNAPRIQQLHFVHVRYADYLRILQWTPSVVHTTLRASANVPLPPMSTRALPAPATVFLGALESLKIFGDVQTYGRGFFSALTTPNANIRLECDMSAAPNHQAVIDVNALLRTTLSAEDAGVLELLRALQHARRAFRASGHSTLLSLSDTLLENVEPDYSMPSMQTVVQSLSDSVHELVDSPVVSHAEATIRDVLAEIVTAMGVRTATNEADCCLEIEGQPDSVRYSVMIRDVDGRTRNVSAYMMGPRSAGGWWAAPARWERKDSLTWAASRIIGGLAVFRLQEITIVDGGFESFESLTQPNEDVKSLASSLQHLTQTHTLRFKFSTAAVGLGMVQAIGPANLAALTSIHVQGAPIGGWGDGHHSVPSYRTWFDALEAALTRRKEAGHRVESLEITACYIMSLLRIRDEMLSLQSLQQAMM
ncbi:hypothetical protein PENSPDRAFT_668675 [Peniophora sp. CONT]|nr:hypothetical protein PENSPDRAFT_668675 [Peniophora sp. CONT]